MTDEIKMNTVARWVDITTIRVDNGPLGYQREEVGEKKIAAMANDFTPEACTPPMLGERADGTVWVVDGQQRIALMKKLGIKRVLCSMFRSAGRAQEAAVYMKINGPPLPTERGTGRTRMFGTDVFRAAAVAGKEPWKTVAVFLKRKGYAVNRHGGPNRICFTAALVRCWDSDPSASESAFDLHEKISCGDGTMYQSIFRGLWWLFHNSIDANQYLDKLIKAGGTAGLVGKIVSHASLARKGVCEAVAGEALLGVINKGRQHRITVGGNDT